MIRSGWVSARPRRLVLVALAALIPVLAGCEAGNNAPTLLFHYPTDTAGTVVGKLSIRNVFVLGAGLGASLHAGQSASLYLAVVNDGPPDTLLSISAPGSATAVTVPGAGITVRSGHPVFLSGPKPQLVLTGLTRTIASGSSIKLVLTFQKAGPVTLIVPVMPRASHYTTYFPPQPSVTPSAVATKHHKKGSSTSVSPGASVSPGPSTSPTPTPSAS